MHPVIRIVLLIVLGGVLAPGQPHVVIASAAAVISLYVVTGTSHWRPAWQLLRRMRWLFISIIGFYLWLTPGQPLWDSASAWVPTVQGLFEGSTRILALVTLALAVNVLLQTTSRDALVGAVLWLARPLRWVGVAPERLAVRLALVFEVVGNVQVFYATQKSGVDGRAAPVRIADAFVALFVKTLQHADAQALREVQIAEVTHPPWYQWMYPLLWVTLMVVLQNIRPAS